MQDAVRKLPPTHNLQPGPEPRAEPEPKPQPEPVPEAEEEPEPELESEPAKEPDFYPHPHPLVEEPAHELPPPPVIPEQLNFVNPLDIFNAPPPRPPLPPLSMGDFHIWGKRARDPEPKEEKSEVEEPCMNAADTEPVTSVKASSTQEQMTIKNTQKQELQVKEEPWTEPKKEVRPEPKIESVRVKSSPHSSVTNSPALSMRSPGIIKRSPAPIPRPINTTPLMVAIAEECLGKARSSVHDVAMSLDSKLVDEYQRLIATALSCLEAALQNSKLAPREEARLRMRYAAILQEETENLMEAETALGKGITLCDKVRLRSLPAEVFYILLSND